MSGEALIRLGGGTLRRGSDHHYREEGPVLEVEVAAFAIERHAVTNARFARFVAETGYVTVAERPLDPADFPGAELSTLEAGSLVFQPTQGPVDLRDWRRWWAFVPGASWRHPRGPGSDLTGLDEHPVVQVAYEDALAFCAWAGRRLPSEAEWEFAARGGLVGATYAWGEEPNVPGGRFANTWQGSFPHRHETARTDAGAVGFVGTAPVGSYPPNGYGLHEMTGNTWEWTSSAWTPRHEPTLPETEHVCSCGCGPSATGPASARSRVTKGGSHLCSPEYCLRYRPAARSPQTEDSATTHLGFRCAA